MDKYVNKNINIKITPSVKSILNNYDADTLLKTIPTDYQLNTNAINIYKSKIKAKDLAQSTVTLSEQTISWLKALSQNSNNIPIALLFNFLIENIVDCGKINSKSISRALNCYYEAAANDKTLLSEILSAYAESVYYDSETGLSDEAVAKFLVNTTERTENCK